MASFDVTNSMPSIIFFYLLPLFFGITDAVYFCLLCISYKKSIFIHEKPTCPLFYPGMCSIVGFTFLKNLQKIS